MKTAIFFVKVQHLKILSLVIIFIYSVLTCLFNEGYLLILRPKTAAARNQVKNRPIILKILIIRGVLLFLPSPLMTCCEILPSSFRGKGSHLRRLLIAQH